MGVMSSMAFQSRNPLEKMNRRQRRAAMKQTGHTWGAARALAKRKQREDEAESRLAAQASKLTPEQARQALAEWAKRGGQ